MKLIPAPTSRRFRRRLADESGLTLIEVMATALIVALLAAATATALITTAKASGHEQFDSEANSLAAQDQEQLRGLSDAQLYAIVNGHSRTHTVQLGGITFTVVSSATFGSASSSSTCAVASTAYYETTSTVTWSENGQLQTVTENSLLTRPVFGTLAVLVQDPSSNPLAGVTVTVTNTSTSQAQPAQLTGSSGCVSFINLSAGNYTINLAKSGYVDANDTSNPTYTIALPASGTQETYSLGQASGPITGTFQTTAGAAGQADGLSWSAPGWTWSTADRIPSSAGAATTVGVVPSGLYPQTYAVWAGRCLAQQPPTQSGSYPTTVPVPAGQPVPTPVYEPMFEVLNVWGNSQNSTREVPAHIVFTYRDPSGTTNPCFDSWAATLVPATTVSGEPSTGWLLDMGQPYAAGNLTVCADWKSGSTYHYGTVTTPNTRFTSPTQVSITATASGQCLVATS